MTARTTLTKSTLKGPFPSLPVTALSLNLTMTAADAANKNQFAPSGHDLILAWNSGASPRTVTLTSAVNPQNRTGDITTYALAAGEIAALGPIGTLGWVQADGYVYLEASNAEVKFGVIIL